jgi:chemotaxis response regulator CheB
VSHTVLVCDDAIFMRTMISDILAQAGFEVVGEAETGRRRWTAIASSSLTSSPGHRDAGYGRH